MKWLSILVMGVALMGCSEKTQSQSQLATDSTQKKSKVLTPDDLPEVLTNAIYTLKTLSGKASDSLNQVNIRFENFNAHAVVLMRSNGVTVNYKCARKDDGKIECSAYKGTDIIE